MQPFYKRIMLLLLLFGAVIQLQAQKVSLKTNLLYDATTTPNLGIEVGLGRKHTAQLFYGINPFRFSSNETKQLRHWLLMPEYRYWFCEKFNGHFLGIHLMGGQFNIGGIDIPNPIFKNLKNRRYEGWYAGGGITYGYQWMLSRHWNLEASLGLGYDRIHYKQFDCRECAPLDREADKNYFGPTKLALSLMYCF